MSLLRGSTDSITCCSSRKHQQPQHVRHTSLQHRQRSKHVSSHPDHATLRRQQRHRHSLTIWRAQQNDRDDRLPIEQQQTNTAGQTVAPTLMDGVNWYCYTALGLLFLTDFTPLGQWLLSGSGPTAASRLALLQWAAFVLPTLLWARNKGWKVQDVFKLVPANTQQCLIGLAAGPLLWGAINTAIAIKTGNTQQVINGAVEASSSIAASSSSSALLLGSGGVSIQQAPVLLLSAAASPAVAEELLFRGFLLTALQERLGRIDAVAVCAALFALIHLEPSQFFLYCVLGGACGAVTLVSGSIVPAVLLHFGFNAAAVVAGLMLHG